MTPVTQATVLEAIPLDKPVSFLSLIFTFVLDQERQYTRLEKILEKLISQRKVNCVKSVEPLDTMFPADWQKARSTLRYCKFVRTTD